MDREGLLANQAFNELKEYVRAGMEFLAHQDKEQQRKIAERKAREALKDAKKEIKSAIGHIQRSPTLSKGDKARIVNHYEKLATRVDDVEEVNASVRQNLMIMSLLGVVAGYMTHESKGVIHDLARAIATVKVLAKEHKQLQNQVDTLTKSLAAFEQYLDYAQLYVRGIRKSDVKSFDAAGQVRFVLERFKKFATDRGIEVVVEAPEGVTTPPLPVTAYSGIILNLYTNALKALLAVENRKSPARVLIRVANEGKKHVLEVADSGVGIPPNLKRKIWEPLYTTTSDISNPLGSGMGLGLTLVKQVVNDLGGDVSLLEVAPAGYRTCFRGEFDVKRKK